MIDAKTITVLIAGCATLAVFSLLYRENRVYRFVEHLYIGIATGFGIVFGFKNFLWPNVLVPLLGLNITVFPDGSTSAPYNPWVLLYGVALAFGGLYYCSYSKKYAWASRIVVGFSLGIGGGLAFKGFFSEWIPQIQSSFKPLIVRSCHEGLCVTNYRETFENWVFLVAFISVLYYFFFSFKRTTRVGMGVASTGRWLLMICFGAFFGSTVMARMALLVERISFLLHDWWPAVTRVVG